MNYWQKSHESSKHDTKHDIQLTNDILNTHILEPFKMSRTAFSVNMMHLMGISPLEEGHILSLNGLQDLEYDENNHSEGYSRLDYALGQGAGAIERFTYASRISSKDSGPCVVNESGDLDYLSIYSELKIESESVQHFFDSKIEAASAVKKAAHFYGADLVGVAPFDENLLYDSEMFLPRDHKTGQPLRDHVNLDRKVDFGFTPKSVIVMAYEMDKEAYKIQPSYISQAATILGYSKMIENSYKVAVFLKNLGYNAQHSGNDIGLSVPTAIQAGLGESSRMGLLITPEFGSRVRLAKVYTDLEIDFDHPIFFGVKETCKTCMACAKKCPAGAISTIKDPADPNSKPHNCSNRSGDRKWYTDGQKCLAQWGKGKVECAMCIMTCRYSY